jgi:hypothetical protein
MRDVFLEGGVVARRCGLRVGVIGGLLAVVYSWGSSVFVWWSRAGTSGRVAKVVEASLGATGVGTSIDRWTPALASVDGRDRTTRRAGSCRPGSSWGSKRGHPKRRRGARGVSGNLQETALWKPLL